MTTYAEPFPVIVLEEADVQQWPAPPFAWRHLPSPGDGIAQPARMETHGGACADVEMLRFDPVGGKLTLRSGGEGREMALPFSRFRRLTLTAPLRAAPRFANAPVERVPAAAQERDYQVQLTEGGAPLTGRTAGHVERAEGHYLFEPTEEDDSVRRIFVPRSACAGLSLGRSAEEIAADRWIASPQALLAAIARQRHAPVLPIGQSMIELGLLTGLQLQRSLSRQQGDVPLGEMLVQHGLISRSDLQTALAYKMGYPLVDLDRFPIDPAAVRTIPPRLALWSRTLPLMLDGDRLVVAMDKPSRVSRLRDLQVLAQVSVIPVLAVKAKILLQLARLAQQDVWFQNVPTPPGFFATTS